MWLAGYAISKGIRLKYSEGLIKGGAVIAGQDEKEVFTALGLPYVLPSMRETGDGSSLWMAPKE